MGGNPNPGTAPDKRLKANKKPAKKAAPKKAKKAAPTMPMYPPKPKP